MITTSSPGAASIPGGAPTNLVSQALANLMAASQTMAAVTGLPATAAAVQSQAVSLVGQIVPVVQSVRQQVQQFVQAAGPLVTNALAALDASNPGAALNIVTNLQTAATALSTNTAGASQQLGKARDTSDGCVSQMAAVVSGLDGQIASANAQRASDQQEVDSLNKTKYYWLALGPFGLVGLGVAIGELVTANNKVASVEAQISALNQQAAQAAKMKIDVQQFSADMADLSTRLQGLQNAVDFVSADVQSVMKDLSGAQAMTAAKAFLLTVQGELTTLSNETA